MPPDLGISPDFRLNKIDSDVARRILRVEGTPRAVRTFSNHHRPMTDHGYWFLLGTIWVSYTGHSDLGLWRRLFSSQRPLRDTSLMKPGELEAFRALPDMVPCWRAHRPDEIDWIAYTMSEEVATRFARERGVRWIIQWFIPKNDLLCLFLRRGEQEVICLNSAKAMLGVQTKIQNRPFSPLG